MNNNYCYFIANFFSDEVEVVSCSHIAGMGAIWLGTRGRVPPLFQTGGHNIPRPPTFFSKFCIRKGFKNKSEVCHVLCEELFKLDSKPHIPKLMWKQFGVVSLILLVYKF